MGERLIKSLIFDVILKAAIAKVIAAIPILGWPVINPLFVFIVNKIGTIIYEELARHVAFTLVDWKTEEERKEYEAAAAKLKDVISIPDEHWENESEKNAKIEAAKAEFKKKLGELIDFRDHAA